MTLIDAILKAKLNDEGKYSSPPPEVVDFELKAKKKRVYKYGHIPAKVDSSPPRYDLSGKFRKLEHWRHLHHTLYNQNVLLLMRIKRAYYMGGLVDCRWRKEPIRTIQYYQHRVDFLKRVRRDNLALYKRILNTHAMDCKQYDHNAPPATVSAVNVDALSYKCARVYLKLGMRDGAVLGEICVELFTDTCPRTCQLFLELLDGDTLGHGYVNTCFFRKVPQLYWSGGDVIYNNGFGCYAQRGREVPIGAENYHYPHSMPGLLSMRVTADDEMCGIFNITFKALPQLDLHNVVFGRVIRPCSTYNIMRGLGNALSSRPVVEVRSTRRKVEGQWVSGAPNTGLAKRSSSCLRKALMM